MTAQGGDLLAWLESAITKAEADSDRWHDAECSFHETTLIDVTVLQGGATLCDCKGPASVRRRCAADRRLIELHAPTQGFTVYGGSCTACSACGAAEEYPVRYPCPSVLALAEGYGWTEVER